MTSIFKLLKREIMMKKARELSDIYVDSQMVGATDEDYQESWETAYFNAKFNYIYGDAIGESDTEIDDAIKILSQIFRKDFLIGTFSDFKNKLKKN